MVTMINGEGVLVSIGLFYAAMYWGFVLSTFLVGISFVQGYLYFSGDNKDRWSMKALVILLLILDPATSLLTGDFIYNYFIVNFGVVDLLRRIPTQWVVENGLTVLVIAVVQVFFASRVYLVNRTVDALPLGTTAPALVFAFAFMAFVGGTMRTISTGLMISSSESSVPRSLFETAVTIEESSALVSDILASVCLCYMLAPPRLDSMNRSEALTALFMFTINRAILTSLIQIGMLAAYLSAKDYMYWAPFHLFKSKLYTNTLLAMLNSRSGGSFRARTIPQELELCKTPAIVEQSISTSECDLEMMTNSKES